jgi:serine/threonine-protein kinase HipA
MNEKLEVWLDADFVESKQRVGTLAHDRGQIRFNYDQQWLMHPLKFMLDPELTLDAAPFFPQAKAGNFGVFLDSSPDRWGQMLMERREKLEAKDENRKPKILYAWDYLLGVQDATRQGALRFCKEGESVFLNNHPLPAPPITSLPELSKVAIEITNKQIDDTDALRQWLSVLVAPGASLGGARPKANFREVDGSMWIAKFPARDDAVDASAWESVLHTLAQAAHINVPPAKAVIFTGNYHTFCLKRFDRVGDRRVYYASAMTLLKKEQSEGVSYLEMAYFLQKYGSHIDIDLEQLFRRVVFNVAVSNRDDHLRNHGFLLNKDGWRLSPAFDVNPNIDKAEHVLNLDDDDNRPSIETVLGTAEKYGLSNLRAEEIIDEILNTVSSWKKTATKAGISRADIEFMESAFSVAR